MKAVEFHWQGEDEFTPGSDVTWDYLWSVIHARDSEQMTERERLSVRFSNGQLCVFKGKAQ